MILLYVSIYLYILKPYDLTVCINIFIYIKTLWSYCVYLNIYIDIKTLWPHCRYKNENISTSQSPLLLLSIQAMFPQLFLQVCRAAQVCPHDGISAGVQAVGICKAHVEAVTHDRDAGIVRQKPAQEHRSWEPKFSVLHPTVSSKLLFSKDQFSLPGGVLQGSISSRPCTEPPLSLCSHTEAERLSQLFPWFPGMQREEKWED